MYIVVKYVVYELSGNKYRNKHKLAQFSEHDDAVQFVIEQMSQQAHGRAFSIEEINVKYEKEVEIQK
jgi:hypothetical protein